MAEPLPVDILDGLQRIGLTSPDPADSLHQTLVATLYRVRGHSDGARLVALKFDFNWAMKAAGDEFATAKTNYEHFVAKTKSRLMLADGYSGVKAEAVAVGDEAAYALLLRYRVAEQRERALRKFLETLSSALDNHRTDRADQRQADTFQARGGVLEQR